MSKKLIDFLSLLEREGLVVESSICSDDVSIDCLTYDTREVGANTLFVCKGAHFKSEYAYAAFDNGAVAYVSEVPYPGLPNMILVSDVRLAMVHLALYFYDNAPSRITSIGITGTKGKSTTAYFLRSVLDSYLASLSRPACAIVSSIETYDGVVNEASHITTPEAIPLHRHFNNAAKSGISHMVMEVSSQALKYDRVLGINFDVACFINIGLDHISPIEHSDFEDYFSSKLKLFDNCRVACINMDAEHSDRVLSYASGKCPIVTFGSTPDCTIYCESVRRLEDGTHFFVKTPDYSGEVVLTMPGLFNVSNALATIAMSYVLKIPMDFVVSGLRDVSVGGRMQVFSSHDKSVVAIVDYAHNRLSFETVFDSVAVEYPGYKVVAVFGCPGNKAIVRRKDMGEVAGEQADYIYITEDDPDEELFIDIAHEIEKYVGNCPHSIVEDRGEAIKSAIFGDYIADKRVVLLLGKGAETTQKRGTVFVDYPSDSENAVKYLKEYDKGHVPGAS